MEDRPDECQLNLAAMGRCGLCSGLLALTFGIIVLALHDDWGSWQAGLVTTIGWLGLIKGITILALPAPDGACRCGDGVGFIALAFA